MKESEIQKQILAYLKSAGLFAWRNHIQGIRQSGRYATNPARGSFDILGYFPTGRGFQIEVKRPTGQLSEFQLDWMKRCANSNVAVCIAKSVDDVRDFINQYEIEMI